MPRVKTFPTLFLALFLAACTVGVQDATDRLAQTPSSSSSSVRSAAVPEGMPEAGSADAPVTLRLFVNHDSPYSRQFHAHMPMLEREFIGKGTVKLQIVPVAFAKYPDSERHARMLLCAAAQGKGMAMHGLLMTGSETLLPADTDRQAYESCMTDAGTAARVAAFEAFAEEEGITLVPTYDINGKRFVGLPTEADLRGSIEAAL